MYLDKCCAGPLPGKATNVLEKRGEKKNAVAVFWKSCCFVKSFQFKGGHLMSCAVFLGQQVTFASP